MSNILAEALDLNDPEADEFLEGIQSNILKFHARRHAVALFLSFRSEAATVREKLAKLAERIATSASVQAAQTKAWKETKRGHPQSSEPLRMITLSAEAYRYLEMTEHMPPARAEYFSRGMRNSASYGRYGIRWDPHTDSWSDEYNDVSRPVHMMLLVAGDDVDALAADVTGIRQDLAKFAEIVAQEKLCRDLHNGKADLTPREHFGFRDGISGPRFVKQDVSSPRPEGWLDRSPEYPLDRLFVRESKLKLRGPAKARSGASKSSNRAVDSEVAPPDETFGSFLSVLKLEQNVAAFQQACKKLGQEIDYSGEDVQAMAIGRRKDGTPLISTVAPDGRNTVHVDDRDDFNYSADPLGLQCPVHSHIRQMNGRFYDPRDDQKRDKNLRVVIARRGMVYGGPREDLEEGTNQRPPSEGVGLLFMSFQADLTSFVALQSAAQNHRTVGFDPVLGLTPRGADENYGAQEWSTRRLREKEARLADFAKPKGGEYLFAPSMHFLRNIDSLELDKDAGSRQGGPEVTRAQPQPRTSDQAETTDRVGEMAER